MVRAKKKQKRLDAIADTSSPSLRRSNRDRHSPSILDSSPVSSPRKKRPRTDLSPNSSAETLNRRKNQTISIDSDEEGGSRLRRRAKGKGEKRNKMRFGTEREGSMGESQAGSDQDGSTENELSNEKDESFEANQDKWKEKEESFEVTEYKLKEKEKSFEVTEEKLTEKDKSFDENEVKSNAKEESSEPKEDKSNEKQESLEPKEDKSKEDSPPQGAEQPPSILSQTLNPQPNPKPNKPHHDSSPIKEGRKCGLCGGGTNGTPPKILLPDSIESDKDKETCEGSQNPNSDESNYDLWDGFGDEPGWLGRLLGPVRDRIGLARVWVHQNCAVWSPEVYFAGPGYLKSIRAALYRGKSLKCSRCSRPGATIGCRVDRCPKTYHLPCSRAVGCIFDHRKFLIACKDHRHLFEPQGAELSLHLNKLKLKKLRADLKKRSNEARKTDLDAEEKWLENCGEDEEFLKRESKRLNRDLQRIAPTFIGGKNNRNDQIYEGFESVAGLKDVINCMKEVVILPLLYPKIFTSLNLTPPRGVLLHGHPGTGKTLIVRALIGACSRGEKKIAYFARKGADCLGKYVGDAERQLRLLFQTAEKSQPSVIFFDEIDGLAPSRSKRQDQTHNSVVATLLSLMDGLKNRGSVVVIGATNRPDAVDPALRRPGRFDREIYFPLPSKEDRVSILTLHTNKWPKQIVSKSVISFVADQTVGYSGADLQSICTQTVVNSLKRNFPLKDTLLKAERGVFGGGFPALPAVSVEERDWIEALMSAPPPCARRLAGSVIADISTLPLDSCLVPCLLRPLCRFLVAVCLDERVWLPYSLLKCGLCIKSVIFSELERNNIPPIPLWSSHIYSILDEPHVGEELTEVLSKFGVISSRIEPKEVEFDVNNDKFMASRSKSDGYNNKLLGFRALIGGAHGSGQQKLASCLLHGFLGQIEIVKVNLATMSLEGNGDIISGLTQILLKCLNMGRCIIFMPRIDLWAIDRAQKLGPAMNDDVSRDVSRVSEIWSAFMEQVDSACTSNSTIILATSEMQFDDLPLTIRKFFNTDESNSHTIPRFSLNLDGKFNPNEVINSCASKVAHDLIQHYIQLVHQTSHNTNNTDPDPQIELQSPNITEIEKEKENPTSTMEIPKKATMKSNNNNITTGAISSIGYQILVYPQFAELCWVTSKLKEGPCTDIKGPWRGWPFSSCIIRTSNDIGTKSQCNIVRGLVAVGLLAYKGVYISINEVCFEVRRVLELLAKKIKIRVSENRDPYRYFRVLTQMAYLEDMVMNWAYSFKRTYGESRMAEPSTKPTIHEKIHIENPAQNDETPTNEENNSNPNETNDSNPNYNPNEPQDHNPNDISIPSEAENSNPSEAPFQDNDHEMHEANDSTVPQNETPNQLHESEITEPAPMETQELGTGAGTETMFVSREKDTCIYNCCSDCYRDVHNTVSEAVSRFWKTHPNCSRVDDMHDIITTYALNVITSVTKKHASQSILDKGEFVARECESHLNDGENYEEKLSFWFKDGVLMPSNVGVSGGGVEKFHCDFKRLCLSPILDMVTL